MKYTPKPKKCKNAECGKMFTPQYSSLQKVCSPGCAAKLSKVVAVEQERKKHVAEKKAWHMKNDKLSVFENRLQIEINAIARAIDNGCNCLACAPDTPIKMQFASHFHSVGSNSTIRFNLHNVHNGCFSCNGNKGGNVLAYKKGLKRVYGERYAEYVESTIVAQYPSIKWTREHLCEWIVVARQIKKELHSKRKEYSPLTRIALRNGLNNNIGIYTKPFNTNNPNL